MLFPHLFSLASPFSPYSLQYNELVRSLHPTFTDDPYYYLYYGTAPRSSFPSYFSLEASTGGTVGHVVRFDSLSKILSAGIRVGFVTGPARIVNAIDMHVCITYTSHISLSTSAVTVA